MVSPIALNATSLDSSSTHIPCSKALACVFSSLSGAAVFLSRQLDTAMIRIIAIKGILTFIIYLPYHFIHKLLFSYAVILKTILIELFFIENITTGYDQRTIHRLLQDAPGRQSELLPFRE